MSFEESEDSIQKEITIKVEKKTNQKIRKQGTADTETKYGGEIFQCTYKDCGKVYSSPVSMNLHIKTKHNGGTKKERQAYAVIIV